MVNFEDENFFFETFVEALSEALAYAKGEPNNCKESIWVDTHKPTEAYEAAPPKSIVKPNR